MHQPLDTLIKRQNVYIGDIFNKYQEFPGIYVEPLPNEYPNEEWSNSKIDMRYYVKICGKSFIINNEDESKAVDLKTLLKCDRYKVELEYAYKKPVISTITTIAPLEECERVLRKSMTQTLKPIIKSYISSNAEKILNSISDKIISGETLSEVEALELIMLPKRFTSGHEEVLNKVCQLFKMLKVDDEKYKYELTLELRCIIHKYAKTEEDIYYLEKVIGLIEAKTAMEYHEAELIKKGKAEGILEGKTEGSFEMALKIKHEFGIEKALEMSDFTIEELESEKLQKK